MRSDEEAEEEEEEEEEEKEEEISKAGMIVTAPCDIKCSSLSTGSKVGSRSFSGRSFSSMEVVALTIRFLISLKSERLVLGSDATGDERLIVDEGIRRRKEETAGEEEVVVEDNDDDDDDDDDDVVVVVVVVVEERRG
jgi:hypothetical protein